MNNFKDEAERRYPVIDMPTTMHYSQIRKRIAFYQGADFGYQQGIADKEQYAAQEVAKVRDELTRKAFYWKDKYSSCEKENESLKKDFARFAGDNLVLVADNNSLKQRTKELEGFINPLAKTWDNAEDNKWDSIQKEFYDDFTKPLDKPLDI